MNRADSQDSSIREVAHPAGAMASAVFSAMVSRFTPAIPSRL